MTGRYKAYPEYKDSGVEWLKEIPVDWKVSRLKFITSIFGRIGFRGYTTADIVDEGEGALVLSPSNVFNGKLDLNTKTFLSWDKYYESPEIIVEPNDILLVKTGSTFGKSAIVDDSSEPMTINPQMALLKWSKIPPKYLAYVMSSKLIKSLIDVSNTGSGMPTMTQENINSFPIPMPSSDWAERIASFLDHETAKIDTLIAKQEKLIELLKEKRQAVISHAVTKGVNPNAPMKDSGVEWLGTVPEHWCVPKLIQLTSRIGDGLHSTPKYADDTGYYFVNGNNLKDGSIIISNTAKEVPEDEYKKHAVSLGDGTVLLSINGTIGSVALYNHESIILGKSAAYINCETRLSRDFLMRYLQSSNASRYYDLEVTGTTISNLSLNSIRQMKVALPPLQEQTDIAEYCEAQIKKYDDLIDKANKLILFSKERKTALISAAVTGKIDVRDFVAEQEQPQGAQG